MDITDNDQGRFPHHFPLWAKIGVGVIATAGVLGAMRPATKTVTVYQAAPVTTTAVTVPSTTSVRYSLKAWATEYSPAIEPLSADTDAIAAAAGSFNIASMIRLCKVWSGHLDTLAAVRPAPDAILAGLNAEVISAYRAAARACIDGDFETTTRRLRIGGDAITAAGARVKVLSN